MSNISYLLNINQLWLVNLSYSDVMLGRNGESPLWSIHTHTNVSYYTIIIIIIMTVTEQ